MSRKKLTILLGTIAYIFFILGCILAYAVQYITQVIQVESFSQFLYTMQVGMGGASNTIVQILQGFLLNYALWIVLGTLLYGFLLHSQLSRKNRTHTRKKWMASNAIKAINCGSLLCMTGCVGLMISQLQKGYEALKIDQYIEEQNKFSTLYENHYVKPEADLIQVPAKKKNIICIYLESMEATFSDREHGGGFDANLIPSLTRIAKENTDFSAKGDTRLNGGQVTSQTSWTVAGLCAQTSGTPLGISNSQYNHTFSESMLFLPEVVSLGDILEQEGYTNYFMCGSEASYAGRANYFRQHGNYEIYDVQTARDKGDIPENYDEWWGFEDEKLIRFAKEKITKLAAQDEPFNFAMLTADTHFKDGYLCKNCPDDFDEQYENVIRCSDKRIAEFVEWIQQQDFYDDTVIMISGDHLSMDSLINQSVGIDFPRRTYFTVLNGAPYTLDRTRDYCTLDIFPTALEAMGFTIQGHKLGLGTSLYADVPTLCEELGFDDLNTQIAYRSKRFEDEILKNDGYTPEEEDDGFLPFFFNRDDSSSSSSHQTPRLPVFEEE